MEKKWSKAYKPKRKLYVLKAISADGYEQFCQENGFDWSNRFDDIYRPLSKRAFFYLPDSMADDGYSKLCAGVEIGYSDQDALPDGCASITLPGFDVVQISGFSPELLEDIPRLVANAFSYAKLYVENEKIHVVPNSKLPYACYMESVDSLMVEIPVWSIKTKTEEMLTLDNMSKRDLYETAFRDSTTGFFNWNWFKSKLDQCKYIGMGRFYLATFDIKGFKNTNNIFGREATNETYKYICKYINSKKWIMYAAKCEEDNFAMLIPYIEEEELISKLYEMFEELCEIPILKRYKLFYRCGYVLFDENEDINLDIDLEDMARLAQDTGKKNNVTEIIAYSEEKKRNYVMAQRYKLELPKAIEDEDLAVYLQPKCDPQTNLLTGAEALIRWFYKGGDVLSPGQFVPQFEADGTIDIIDRYVLRQVCKKYAEWKVLGYPLLPISVNLSRRQLSRPDLVYVLCDIVDEYGVDHSLIDFEITESSDFEDVNYFIWILNEIKKAGFKISMDDFGTGYSCLGLLKDMPLDILKIDKCFIDGIANSEMNNKDMLMAKDILSIANHMGIKSLAEGVETFEQKEYLRQWGCHYIQGYYYSKPIPVSNYEYLLRQRALGQPVI